MAALTTHVGKESNKLEEVGAGVEHDPDEVWAEYVDAKRDPWRTVVLPVLRLMPVAELEGLGMHRRSLFAVRAGERLPHPRNRQLLTQAAGAFAREHLAEAGIDPPYDDLTACAASSWTTSEVTTEAGDFASVQRGRRRQSRSLGSMSIGSALGVAGDATTDPA